MSPKRLGVWLNATRVATLEARKPWDLRCRYEPAQRSGDNACPFTTLYWDFLMRHEAMLRKNPRMALQVKNLARLTDAQKQAVTQRAASIRRGEVGAGDAGGQHG